MILFDKFPRGLAVVTPVKYECHSKNLKGNFTRLKILFTEKKMDL